MKLSKIYSNKKFKTVSFNDNLNIVLAKVKKKSDLNKDSHNLGKTTLIAVIDFMLLKGLDKSHIFKEYSVKFQEYIFFLEVLLNDGSYLTIKRSVATPTKISFKTHPTKNQNFTNEEVWDEKDLPIKRAKAYLEEKADFDIIPNWPFRKSVTYFLRSQDDYRDVFQLAKFSAGKDVNWKPFLFDLLGFKGDLLKDKYELEASMDRQKDLIKEFKYKLSVDPEELDKIRGAIELKKDERNEIQREIDSFNFYHRERELNKDLVENIEAEVAILNTREYDLQYELGQVESALEAKSISSFEDIRKIWEEAKLVFKDAVVKDYEQLEEFNRKITEERSAYLKERSRELSKALQKIRGSIKVLDEKRAEVLSVLSDKDSFRKFKRYQADISKIEAELVRLEEQLNNIDKIDVFNVAIKEIQEKVDEIKGEIKAQLEADTNKIYPEIRKNFRNIIKYILNSPAILYIVPNTNGNIEYKAEIQSDDEIEITAGGKGFSYKKFLCITFDLAVLMTYSKHSFFRFVYHDGALEGLDNRKKINFIELIRKVCTEYDIQYIFTSIEDHLPVGVEFTKSEIAVELDDSGDDGKLFGMSF